jgi:Fur family ferric uptake transcriptional regulator
MDKTEEIFAKYLTRNGLRMTEQRRAIFNAFIKTDRHLSAEEIYDIVKQAKVGVGIATVWRNMKLIREAGLAEEHHFRDGRVRYERRTPANHGHMICTECGRPVEFDTTEITPFLERISEINSFKAEDYRISIFGKCFLCTREKGEGDFLSTTKGEKG